MSRKDWEKYAIGKGDFKELDSVRHIAHVKDAIRIIEDGTIRSSLIWDESKLNNSRTCVSWVSPNEWASGSIYGNVSFEFDWKEIVSGKNLYWVEDVEEYNPPAYRILVTDKNYNSWRLVSRYDPNKQNGPVHYDGSNWHRNGNYTGEFMIDGDLSLQYCREVEFINHNKRYCSKNGRNCEDIELNMYHAGARVLANVLGRDIHSAKKLFLEKERETVELTPNTTSMLNSISLHFDFDSEYSFMVSGKKNKKAIFKAALILYSEENYEEAYRLVRLFESRKSLNRCFVKILYEFFSIEPQEMAKKIGVRI